MASSLTILIFVFFSVAHTQKTLDWQHWLEHSGLSQNAFEELLGETASSLAMSGQELLNNLVSNAASVDDDPVSLLVQLRDELQMVTEMGDEVDMDTDSPNEEEEEEPNHLRNSSSTLEVWEELEADEVLKELDLLLNQANYERGFPESEKREENFEEGALEPPKHKSTQTRLGKKGLGSPGAQNFIDEVSQQIRSDITRLKKAVDLVFPEQLYRPVVIASAQAFTQAVALVKALNSGFCSTFLPKLRELVLDKGSPGRILGTKIGQFSARSLKSIFMRVSHIVQKIMTDNGPESNGRES